MDRPSYPPRVVTPAFLDALASAAGAGAIRHGMSGLRVAGVEPLAVVEPADAEGVAGVMALCSEGGVPVEAAGGGTWLEAGRRRTERAVVVSTRRLTGLTEYEPADLVAGVRAGTPVAWLESRLGEHGQGVMLDPAGLPESSTGAVLALSSAGPLQAAHGTPRDLVLGVEVVTGDGRLLRFGGRVVKNVAGYDMVRLLVGSGGSLGVITAAYLLLRGVPDEDRTLGFTCRDGQEATELALAVRDRNVAAALEILGPETPADGDAPAGWRVLIRLRGSSAAVEAGAERVIGAAGRAPTRLPLDPSAWEELRRDEARARMLFRLTLPPAELPTAIRLGRMLTGVNAGNSRSSSTLPGGWRLAAHAASGVVRVWWSSADARADGPAQAGSTESLARRVADVRAGIAGAGVLTCPVQPPTLDGAFEPFVEPAAGVIRITRAIRQAFDPAGILAARHG
jgi:glycolate oxidase FAD binding subunit